MRGILGYGAYLPYRRLDRSTIAAVAGGGGGKGTRTVSSHDQDGTPVAGGRGAPARLFLRRGLPREGGRGGPGRAGRDLRRPPGVVPVDREPSLSRQDERDRGPRRPAAPGRRGRRRLRRFCAVGGRRPPGCPAHGRAR